VYTVHTFTIGVDRSSEIKNKN